MATTREPVPAPTAGGFRITPNALRFCQVNTVNPHHRYFGAGNRQLIAEGGSHNLECAPATSKVIHARCLPRTCSSPNRRVSTGPIYCYQRRVGAATFSRAYGMGSTRRRNPLQPLNNSTVQYELSGQKDKATKKL